MNLFRSEEHVRAWSGFKPGTEAGIAPLEDMVQIFSGSLFTRRLDADYVSRMQDYMSEFMRVFEDKDPFWWPPSV